MRNKFTTTGYPIRVFNSAIREFTTSQKNEDNEFVMTPWLFEFKNKIVFVEARYYLKNISSSKQFIETFDEFTDNTFDVRTKSHRKKVKIMFRVKDKSLRKACKTNKSVSYFAES